MNISSIGHWNNFESLKANVMEGLYRPFSNEITVCLETSNNSDSSSCVILAAIRFSRTKFSMFIPTSSVKLTLRKVYFTNGADVKLTLRFSFKTFYV